MLGLDNVATADDGSFDFSLQEQTRKSREQFLSALVMEDLGGDGTDIWNTVKTTGASMYFSFFNILLYEL